MTNELAKGLEGALALAACWTIRNVDTGDIMVSYTVKREDVARLKAMKLTNNYAAYEAVPLFCSPPPPSRLDREAIGRVIRDHVHFNRASGSREVDYEGAADAILALTEGQADIQLPSNRRSGRGCG